MEIASSSITGKASCCWEISLLLIYRGFNLERPLSVLSLPFGILSHLCPWLDLGYKPPASPKAGEAAWAWGGWAHWRKGDGTASHCRSRGNG